VLFNSFEFIFGFLPLVLAATYLLGRFNQPAAKIALLLLSLGFYTWWRPAQLPLLLISIVFNFVVGALIQRAVAAGRRPQAKALLVVGVLADVAFLGWFKYANFIVDNVNAVAGANIVLPHIALPLAISFFTFQKLAYLIDSARGETRPISFLDFSLFAAFFPQLIAGPIVHFKEVVPQLQRHTFGRFISRNLMIGLVLFAMGLFKKTVIADTLAAYANPWFDAAAKGQNLGLVQAWLAALTFTGQLYFDFSGYSDMAIGLGRMFGVKLPLNFHSPLRSPSIMDYWRRWHMTLQRFIVAYVFQPLSLPSTRLAAERGLEGWANFAVSLAFPTFVTFVAVGVWHGAGWTFVLFGVMHATYIIINEAWRDWQGRRRRRLRRAGKPAPEPGLFRRLAVGHGLTLLAVIFANVMFRAHTVHDAATIWSSMTGFSGVGEVFGMQGLSWGVAISLAIAIVLIFLAPNSQQILGRFDPAYNWREWQTVAKAPLSWTWKPNVAGILFAGSALFLGIISIERGRAVFLYFNF
jgi:D-alanyl-lipoteichoic acid acyltransferase DltB (MBOAT superfamily)